VLREDTVYVDPVLHSVPAGAVERATVQLIDRRETLGHEEREPQRVVGGLVGYAWRSM
jgi:hypothetical protein